MPHGTGVCVGGRTLVERTVLVVASPVEDQELIFTIETLFF